MTATPAVAARQIRTARRVNRVQPNVRVYRTTTGDMPSDLKTGQTLHEVKQDCRWVREEGTHVLCNVEADLPGDRSVGTCDCGQYIDTGTWDERNGA